MLDQYPADIRVDKGMLARAIDAALECSQTCTACADACLSEQDVGSLAGRSRVIVRRERPHPGAQLSFTDHDGHRFQAILTDPSAQDIAALERLHRARARVEDRIRAAKQTGLGNLPFRDFEANAVWLALALIAGELIFSGQTLALHGELARCKPKRLRYRLLPTAGRLAFHAQTAILRPPRAWP